MSIRMGVKEFRDRFTTIARTAKEPVIVTSHDKVVGWFTPSRKPKTPLKEILASLDDIRRGMEARGIDVAGRLKALGLEDEEAFEDPWIEAQPAAKRKRK